MLSKKRRMYIGSIVLLVSLSCLAGCTPRNESKSLETMSDQIIGGDATDESTSLSKPSAANNTMGVDLPPADPLPSQDVAATSDSMPDTAPSADAVSSSAPSSKNQTESDTTNDQQSNESTSNVASAASQEQSESSDTSANAASKSVPLPNKTADFSSFLHLLVVAAVLAALSIVIVAIRKIRHRRL